MDIFEFFEKDRYAALSGVRLAEARPGYARASMTVTPQHLNAGGSVQGGAVFTLADLAFAAAVNAYGNLAVSTQTSIFYHKGVAEGTLTAEAREIKAGRTLATYEVVVTDDSGDRVATFIAQAFRKELKLPFSPEEK